MNKRQKMMESKWAESSWAHRVQLENDMAHAHTHTHKLNYPMFVPYFESGPASTASHIPCLCHAISLCLCIFSSTSCSMVAIWHQIEVAGQKRQRSTEKKVWLMWHGAGALCACVRRQHRRIRIHNRRCSAAWKSKWCCWPSTHSFFLYVVFRHA